MSAKRYSGDLTMTITYRDRPDDYRVTITWPDGRKRARHTVYVGRLPSQSVDSPSTIDAVAHAAISFGDEEESDIGNNAAIGPNGWLIARKGDKHQLGYADLERAVDYEGSPGQKRSWLGPKSRWPKR